MLLIMALATAAEPLNPEQMNTVADDVATKICGEQTPTPYHLRAKMEYTKLDECWQSVPPVVTKQLAEGQCKARTDDGLIDCLVATVLRLAPMEGLPLVQISTDTPREEVPTAVQQINCIEMMVGEPVHMERWCYQSGIWTQESVQSTATPPLLQGTL